MARDRRYRQLFLDGMQTLDAAAWVLGALAVPQRSLFCLHVENAQHSCIWDGTNLSRATG